MQSYFEQSLEILLKRVEGSTGWYEVLGLPRSAGLDEIKTAFQWAMTLLRPADFGIRISLPEQTNRRIRPAFERVSQAYSTLMAPAAKAEYDRMLAAADRQAIQIRRGQKPAAVHAEIITERVNSNRRRTTRMAMAIPARVTGYDRINGKWQEMSRVIDVSRTGVALRLTKPVRHGAVVHVSLPLPLKLRSHGYAESSYSVYALVRRIEPSEKGQRLIGLEFLGQNPPPGYIDTPWAVYRTKKWSGPERKREPRIERSVVLKIEYLNAAKERIADGTAVTENLSRSGARVYVDSPPADFDTVRVASRDRNFESLAALCDRYAGKDGFERLCLKFLGAQWPL